MLDWASGVRSVNQFVRTFTLKTTGPGHGACSPSSPSRLFSPATMADSEQDNSAAPFPADPRLLLAATVVLVGSAAYLWRSNLPTVAQYLGRNGDGSAASVSPADGTERANEEARELKAARSKERRRRGKDPLKDLVKNGKKLKGLALSTIPGDSGDARSAPFLSTASHSTQPPHLHSQTFQSSRSISSSSSRRVAHLGDAQAYIDSRNDGASDDEDPMCSSVSVLSSCPTEASSSRARDEGSLATTHASQHAALSTLDDAPCPPSVSMSSTASHSSAASLSSFSESADTSSTSISEFVSTPKAAPDRPNGKGPSSSTSTLHFPGPWDRDDTPPSTKHARRRSRSRVAKRPISPGGATAVEQSSRSHPLEHRRDAASPASILSVSAPVTVAHGRPLDESRASDHKDNGHAVTSVAEPTSGLPTPGSSSTQAAPPSVCFQTQVASLRGALEASRKREEHMRSEMDRQNKEMEMLRWESAHWRRREMEFQSQVHHLMQQLHAYSAMLSSVPAPSHARMRGSNSNGGSPAPTNPTSPTFPMPGMAPMSMFSPPMMPSPGPFSPVLPPHLQPPSMMSPTMQGSPRSPYPYLPEQGMARPYSPMVGQAQPIPQSQSHSELLAVFPSPSRGSSGPSSIETSSRGSASPDNAGGASGSMLDRGRRRTRTQTADARPSGTSSGYDGEWDGEEEQEEDGYGGLSEVLADAILKRPQTMRVGSNKRRPLVEPESIAEEEIVEFSFPSLSDSYEARPPTAVAKEEETTPPAQEDTIAL